MNVKSDKTRRRVITMATIELDPDEMPEDNPPQEEEEESEEVVPDDAH